MGSIIIKIIWFIAAVFICLLLADFGSFQAAVNGFGFVDLICTIIFLFVVFFIITRKSWSEKARKQIKGCIIIYCCLNVFTIMNNFGIMCIKKDREGARRRQCWNNIRIISGAVEFYNMDSRIMMENLDLKLVVNPTYMKNELPIVSNDCYYTNIDNLTENGFVCCAEHFSPCSELGHNGNYMLYDLNENDFKNYICKYTDSPYEAIKKLKDKFTELNKKIKKDRSIIEEQRKELIELNKKIRAEKPYYEQFKLYVKENKETITVVLLPLIVLFFPYVLHPLRN